MAINTEAFLTDLRTALVAVIPEVSEFTEIEHLDKVEWLDLTLPYAAAAFSRFSSWPDQPADTLIFECQVDLWYVMLVPGANSGMRTKLEAIVDVFYPSDPIALGHGQVLDVIGMDYSDELTPNLLYSGAGHAARAGVVRLKCLVGEGP